MPTNIPSDLMGYDRAITVFSPDGRLLQVEYARKTVAQGTTAIGIVCKDGVVLVADKRILDKLIVASSVEKVFQIDTHIGCTMSGLISDGRVLVERAQEEAQRHRLVYDEPIDVLGLTREICNYKQYYTQYAGVRPFGVSLLIAGVDESPRLFLTEPSGIFFEYQAVAIGEGAPVANKILEDEYREDITIEQGIALAIKAIKKFLMNKFKKDRIDVAIIDTQTKKYKKISGEELDKYIKE
ncbi:MAG: archaeal proteasome endopeptidase complex subunit alpha [Candidatus Parvarchaeota archaeon]|nr:archaeal proteasome endopeptidase complex subunit alpha [Candidatus Jingweiarchaeum tengchongense]MCW1298500.1 archaeal proteasome endopeptidase complex subunit alpha [Candidatus Jingweiarchaeum tengchongense]MCW1300254.1 archaeal proteasome endopeptidase complex subunit alpha [Candidatus Jingweiarchaeum tengchongense]MCW1304512.1 archaeal proteasome endopeptidase complex subunit alpha [Candidatus Jingweiarchaeum tengchongense]MCW1305760.1 archaeal proteasome endopeptidase complex subunit al